MIFRRIASILRINGGEIFQQERVEKVQKKTGDGTCLAIGKLIASGLNRGSSYSECGDRNIWEARALLAVTK